MEPLGRTQVTEPARSDWTAAGARAYLYIADAEMMDSNRRDCPWDRANTN
ncbi:MAG: hypothetical protein HC767_03735 [Akkermansiaceae bacterium]|nr:hypothetical protein [Akkermansiaceae bacterium]